MDGLFKSAIGGFRKADVLAYIEQLNAENQKASSELLSRIDELEGETHALRDENAALRERIDSLDGLLEQEKEGAKELGEKVVFLNSQINAQRDKLSRSDLEIHGLHSERDELQEMVRQYQEKLKGYEERQGEISGALVEAKRMAADLVRQGKRQGREERDRAFSELESLSRDMGQLGDQVAGLSETLRAAAAQMQGNLRRMEDTVELYQLRLEEMRAQLGGGKVPAAAPPPPKEAIPAPAKGEEPPPKKAAPVQPEPPLCRERPVLVSAGGQAGGLLKTIAKLLGGR
ncbi:hypothetical protein [Bittarella massiliensis (ex Durand et al. 2017)]|uniref:Chromosome partition protein Smc n=1 Tax=Bittarella massiliensis (ex Durand et al. 2017) TaxID=1720313 RepID=A0AAW5KCS6_9FIRM|nr:hypothetical protein [Bittarella massiliensis (ex Durand et al. 2017)]MCQ4949717.1 hypothetical protein [Bittarella massiliensis (ex Durand et al. 2017)]